jgi:hypothetical protein
MQLSFFKKKKKSCSFIGRNLNFPVDKLKKEKIALGWRFESYFTGEKKFVFPLKACERNTKIIGIIFFQLLNG